MGISLFTEGLWIETKKRERRNTRYTEKKRKDRRKKAKSSDERNIQAEETRTISIYSHQQQEKKREGRKENFTDF